MDTRLAKGPDMLTLNDLQALDDAAFNRAIAEADGWKIEHVFVEWQSGTQYRVRRPDGTVVAYLADTGRYTDIRPLTTIGDVIPDYAHDLNAAWALPLSIQTSRSVIYDYERDERTCAGVIWERHDPNAKAELWLSYHERPARALATAWYAWLLDQRERKE